MAKTVKCAFCGKELQKGLLSGNAQALVLGGYETLDVCEDCKKHYESVEVQVSERFGAKLMNYKRTNKIKKINQAEIAKLYDQYVRDEAENVARYSAVEFTFFKDFYCYENGGRFTVKEFANGFLGEDVGTGQMVKTIKKSKKEDTGVFTKDDITKIEYAVNGSGSFVGLFRKAYSFSIRLNDETVLQYKPCITRSTVLGYGFMFGYRGSAEKRMVKELEGFKKAIGSDLPIVKVKKM